MRAFQLSIKEDSTELELLFKLYLDKDYETATNHLTILKEIIPAGITANLEMVEIFQGDND